MKGKDYGQLQKRRYWRLGDNTTRTRIQCVRGRVTEGAGNGENEYIKVEKGGQSISSEKRNLYLGMRTLSSQGFRFVRLRALAVPLTFRRFRSGLFDHRFDRSLLSLHRPGRRRKRSFYGWSKVKLCFGFRFRFRMRRSRESRWVISEKPAIRNIVSTGGETCLAAHPHASRRGRHLRVRGYDDEWVEILVGESL